MLQAILPFPRVTKPERKTWLKEMARLTSQLQSNKGWRAPR
ncbi:hypothetical protein PSTT_10931 [Puccinia striiformis]|uniref:Uncharacterized protein n=1 Tax=Puccinia striiformis TaxID=27350 RepID=A0A2S4V2C9_9BASI|nr:hypothetical protein PSTT_10931 [Puccinia striiformis]